MVRRRDPNKARPAADEFEFMEVDEEEEAEAAGDPEEAGGSGGRGARAGRRGAAAVERNDSSASEGQRATPRKRARDGPAPQAQAEGTEVTEGRGEADAELSDFLEEEGGDGRDYGPNADLLSLDIPPRPDPVMAADGTGERLMIYYLEVENFKSYRGKRIIGPFHQCFTSVIGPNGSGKSNVIDALLFVFAFKANRIRSKKLAALIHKSKGFENVGACSVTVHFQRIRDVAGDPGFEVVGGTEFTVGRRATAANASTYYIDGRRAQPQEVIDKLEEYGIDLKHNRFLILQGEVEQISQMKPKAPEPQDGGAPGESGMLEYLEDIIGSNRFQKPIAALEKRADELSDKRASKLDKVKRARTEVDHLEDKFLAAVELLKTENNLKRLDNLANQIKRYKATRHKNKAKRKLDEAQAEHEEKSKELERLKAEKAERRKALDHLEASLKKHQENLEAFAKQIEETDENDKRLKLEKTAEEKKSNKAKEKERKLGAELEKKRAEPARLEKESEALKAELERLAEKEKEAAAEYEAAAAKLEAATKPLQAKRYDAEAQLEKLEPRLNEAKNAAGLAKGELDQIRSNQRFAQAEVDKAEKTLKGTVERLEAARAAEAGLSEKVPGLEKEGADARRRYERLRPDYERTEAQLKEKRQRFQALQNTAHAAQQQNQLVRVLMEAQAEGRVQGVHGRLGDLGGIDQRYDIAISTAAGALNNIVVDSVNVANQCLKIIREAGLNGSFIALDKMEQHRRNMQAPARLCKYPRLFDLIKVEDGPMKDILMVTFFFAIRDWVVAPSKNEAQQYSSSLPRGEGFNIVTEDGTQYKRDGAIIGGGVPRRGLMGRNATNATPGTNRRDMERLEEEVRKLEEDFNKLSRDFRAEAETIQRVEQTLPEAQANLRRAAGDARAGTQAAEVQQKALEAKRALLAKAAPDEVEEQRLSDALAQTEAAAADVVHESQRIQALVTEAEEQMDAVKKDLIGQPKKTLDTLKKEMDNHRKTINSNTAKINSSGREVAKLESQIEKTVKEREEADARGEKLTQERKSLDDVVLKIADKNEKEENLLEKVKEEYQKAKEKIDEEGTETKDLELRVVELKKLLEEMEALYRLEKNKIKDIERYLKHLKLHDLVGRLGEREVSAMMDAASKKPNVGNLNFASSEDDEEEDPERPGPSQPRSQTSRESQGQGQGGRGGRDEPMDVANELNNIQIRDEDSLDALLSDGYSLRSTELHQYEEDFLKLFTAKAGDDLNASQASRAGEEEGEGRKERRKSGNPQMELLRHKENQLKQAHSTVAEAAKDLGVIDEYREKRDSLEAATTELDEVTRRRDAHRQKAERFRLERQKEFSLGFDLISTKLKEMYQMITQGGDAELELVDSCDPFQGIIFSVRPPKKSWKQISNLSGGEKTLSSLALVFALHQYRPTPLYVMDEIDAALDYKNVSIVGHYIKTRTKNAQFIIISLRNQMFELANRLVGIYKVDDSTGNVTIDPDKIAALPPGELANADRHPPQPPAQPLAPHN